MRRLVLVMVLWFNAGLACAPSASAQTFDNASVIALHHAGLAAEVIVAKIRTLPCNYDISTDRLISLKQAGVPNAVIAEMVSRCNGSTHAQGVDDENADPRTMHAPGIYLARAETSGTRLLKLRPTLSSAVKLTGNGSILFPRQMKVLVPQGGSQIVASVLRPVFWFYFNTANRKAEVFGEANSSVAESPDEYSLVRLRRDGGVRQFVVGRVEPFVAVAGIDAKRAVPFTTHDMGDGVFRVDVAGDLEPGEYAFVLPGEKGTHPIYRIYDFAVPGVAVAK